MGFWNKLGKIALQAAPYVAAPFTGGASLMATGATQQLGKKWAEHDAQKAYEKGLGPSSFDRVLGGISAGAGMASGMGAFDKLGGMRGGGGMDSVRGDVGRVDQRIGAMNRGGSNGGGGEGWQGTLQNILGGQQRDPYSFRTPPFVGGGGGGMGIREGEWDWMPGGRMGGGGGQDFGGSLRDIIGAFRRPDGQQQGGGNPQQGGGYAVPREDEGLSRFHRQMRRQLGPVMGQENQNFPNLADSIGAGRMEAIRNQPWRGGYDINTQNDDAEGGMTTYQTPPIYPTGQRRRRNQYGNELGGGEE